MKLQDQVCTLEQAKLLKSLGVKQESLFYHHPNFDVPVFGNKWSTAFGKKYQKTRVQDDKASAAAYTVAELGVMLPDHYPSWRFPVGLQIKWIATVICSPKPPGIYDVHTAHEFDRFGNTQAEALASLLIALLKTGAIKADEVNMRLCA